MQKIEKLLKKIGRKDRVAIEGALEKLISGHHKELDIKKLKLTGYKSAYRVRVGDFRIIFIANSGEIYVLDIERRSEKTYKNI